MSSSQHGDLSLGLHAPAQHLAGVIVRLEQRSEQVGRAMSKATRERVPEIVRAAALDQDLPDRLDQMCIEHVRAFTRHAAGTEPPDETKLTFVRQLGVRRSRDLFPLEALMRGLRVGQQVLWNEIVAEAGATAGGQSAALALTESLIEYTEAVGRSLERSYIAEQERLAADSAMARQALLEDLLSGRLFSRPEGPRRALAAGFEADADYVVAAIGVSRAAPPDAVDTLCSALQRLTSPQRRPPFTARRGDAVIAVVTSADVDDVRNLVLSATAAMTSAKAAPITAGIGGPCCGIAQIAGACEAAQLALRHARRCGGVVLLDELRLFDYLVDGADPTAHQLGRRHTDLLVAEEARRGSALIQTLSTYVDCDMNVARAAEVLNLHPNTIRHRLSRIEALSGLDTRCVRDVMELATAIELARPTFDT